MIYVLKISAGPPSVVQKLGRNCALLTCNPMSMNPFAIYNLSQRGTTPSYLLRLHIEVF